jgi:hypothetical protein
VFALTWHAGDTAQQRAWLIDHHGALVEELRGRGRIIQATVDRKDPRAEHYAVRIAPYDGEDDQGRALTARIYEAITP